MSMKNPLTLAGIEPATFRFVAQHLNHCATARLLSKHVNNQNSQEFTLINRPILMIVGRVAQSV